MHPTKNKSSWKKKKILSTIIKEGFSSKDQKTKQTTRDKFGKAVEQTRLHSKSGMSRLVWFCKWWNWKKCIWASKLVKPKVCCRKSSCEVKDAGIILITSPVESWMPYKIMVAISMYLIHWKAVKGYFSFYL